MNSEKLYKDHLRLFVRAYVRQHISAAQTIRCLAPLLRDFEQSRDLVVSENEMRRMYENAVAEADADANRGAVCVNVGHPWTSPEEIERKKEAAEAAAVQAGRGTLRSPIDLTRRHHEKKWYEAGDEKKSVRRRKSRAATG